MPSGTIVTFSFISHHLVFRHLDLWPLPWLFVRLLYSGMAFLPFFFFLAESLIPKAWLQCRCVYERSFLWLSESAPHCLLTRCLRLPHSAVFSFRLFSLFVPWIINSLRKERKFLAVADSPSTVSRRLSHSSCWLKCWVECTRAGSVPWTRQTGRGVGMAARASLMDPRDTRSRAQRVVSAQGVAAFTW